MSRAAKRSCKEAFQKDIVEFLKVQNHFMPHYVTINECLEKLPPNELEKYWLVIVDATKLFYFKEKT
jgi:hypothetical protein